MKNIFHRKPKQPQPIINDPHSADTSLLPLPTTAVIPIVEFTKPVLQCAACGATGATQQLKMSCFGYMPLPFVYLCEECYALFLAKHREHNRLIRRAYWSKKDTALEMPALGGVIRHDGLTMV